MALEYLTATLEVSKHWSNACKILKKNDLQHRTPYLSKLSIKYKIQIPSNIISQKLTSSLSCLRKQWENMLYQNEGVNPHGGKTWESHGIQESEDSV